MLDQAGMGQNLGWNKTRGSFALNYQLEQKIPVILAGTERYLKSWYLYKKTRVLGTFLRVLELPKHLDSALNKIEACRA